MASLWCCSAWHRPEGDDRCRQLSSGQEHASGLLRGEATHTCFSARLHARFSHLDLCMLHARRVTASTSACAARASTSGRACPFLSRAVRCAVLSRRAACPAGWVAAVHGPCMHCYRTCTSAQHACLVAGALQPGVGRCSAACQPASRSMAASPHQPPSPAGAPASARLPLCLPLWRCLNSPLVGALAPNSKPCFDQERSFAQPLPPPCISPPVHMVFPL